MPDPDHLPTGAELIQDYLAPLAAHPAIAPHLRLGAEVVAISRVGHSKIASEARDDTPFVVVTRNAAGRCQQTLVRAVIDASGTRARPNPIGLDGLPVDGEAEAADRIAYRIPDVLGADRARYEGRHALLVGAGHGNERCSGSAGTPGAGTGDADHLGNPLGRHRPSARRRTERRAARARPVGAMRRESGSIRPRGFPLAVRDCGD